MDQALPEGLKNCLEAIPKPGPGQFISLSLSMTIRYAFPFPDSSRTKNQIRLEDVVAIISSTVYTSLVELIKETLDDEIPEERRDDAIFWLSHLWERQLLLQPRFCGLIPDYAAGEWRWTGDPTAIPFREL